MKNTFLIITIFTLVCPLLNAARDDQDKSAYETPPGKRYTYKQSGGEAQDLEVYFPSQKDPAKPAPGILLFHGGGWSHGDLDQFRHACQYFASRGLVAATANYQMLAHGVEKTPEGISRKAVCVIDAKSAIRWMKQHAAELGMDPKRLIVGGGSAGGHISLLATLNPGLNDPQDPKEIDTSVAAYVEFNPALDVTPTEGEGIPSGKGEAKGSIKTPPEVNALNFVTATVAPGIYFFGSEDSGRNSAKKIRDKLESLGNHNLEIWIAEGEKHGFFNHIPWYDVTLIEADRWLVAHGFLSGTTTLKPPASGEKMVKMP